MSPKWTLDVGITLFSLLLWPVLGSQNRRLNERPRGCHRVLLVSWCSVLAPHLFSLTFGFLVHGQIAVFESESESVGCSVMSESLQPHGLYNLLGSSVHGILQVRMLEWVAVPFSRRSYQLRDWTWVSCIGRWILYHLSHQESFERPLFKNDQYLVGSKQTFHWLFQVNGKQMWENGSQSSHCWQEGELECRHKAPQSRVTEQTGSGSRPRRAGGGEAASWALWPKSCLSHPLFKVLGCYDRFDDQDGKVGKKAVCSTQLRRGPQAGVETRCWGEVSPVCSRSHQPAAQTAHPSRAWLQTHTPAVRSWLLTI